MPRIVVELTPGEESAFGDDLLRMCARQMLARYVTDEDGEQTTSPTELARKLEAAIVAEIQTQAREAAPGIVERILADKVVTTDRWGSREGEKPVAELIAEQVKREAYDGQSGRRGEGVLAKLIRDEVERQFAGELREALQAAKAPLLEAVREQFGETLDQAMRKAVGA